MRRCIQIALFLLLLSVLWSCNDKIKIAAPYKDVLIIYGLFDAADTAHYVRIQKAFLDENKNVYDMAQVADSNYLKTLSVQLKKIDAAGHVDSVFTLPRVDITTEGYPKDSGVFFNNVNYAYKFANALDPAYTYRLVVTNTATGITDSAETSIINESKDVFQVGFFNIANYTLDFADTAYYKMYHLPFYAPGTAQTFSGTLRIRWYDVNLSTNDSVLRTVDWNFASTALNYVAPGGNSVILSAYDVDFYRFLATAMGPAPIGIVRHMAYNDIYIYAATPDFYQYQLIANNNKVGITGEYTHPDYTNFKGPDVIGLFTSRAVRVGYNYYFSVFTINSLEAFSVMAGTNIQDK